MIQNDVHRMIVDLKEIVGPNFPITIWLKTNKETHRFILTYRVYNCQLKGNKLKSFDSLHSARMFCIKSNRANLLVGQAVIWYDHREKEIKSGTVSSWSYDYAQKINLRIAVPESEVITMPLGKYTLYPHTLSNEQLMTTMYSLRQTSDSLSKQTNNMLDELDKTRL